MLGPDPKKAGTPSTAKSSGSDSGSSGDGLMVKAIDDIFRFVEASENPQEFRVRTFLKIARSRHERGWNIMRKLFVKPFINSRHDGVRCRPKGNMKLCRKALLADIGKRGSF